MRRSIRHTAEVPIRAEVLIRAAAWVEALLLERGSGRKQCSECNQIGIGVQ